MPQIFFSRDFIQSTKVDFYCRDIHQFLDPLFLPATHETRFCCSKNHESSSEVLKHLTKMIGNWMRQLSPQISKPTRFLQLYEVLTLKITHFQFSVEQSGLCRTLARAAANLLSAFFTLRRKTSANSFSSLPPVTEEEALYFLDYVADV